MYKFNLTCAMAGEPVITRAGKEAKFIAADDGTKFMPYEFKIKGERTTYFFTKDGVYRITKETEYDLFMASEPKKAKLENPYPACKLKCVGYPNTDCPCAAWLNNEYNQNSDSKKTTTIGVIAKQRNYVQVDSVNIIDHIASEPKEKLRVPEFGSIKWAIEEMQKGKKVCHAYYTRDEWTTIIDGKVVTEDKVTQLLSQWHETASKLGLGWMYFFDPQTNRVASEVGEKSEQYSGESAGQQTFEECLDGLSSKSTPVGEGQENVQLVPESDIKKLHRKSEEIITLLEKIPTDKATSDLFEKAIWDLMSASRRMKVLIEKSIKI